MWIVFGWDKEIKPIGVVATGYCFDCRRTTDWVVWNESEWATFSAIRIIRFINKHRLHCDNCTLQFDLSSPEIRQIDRHMKKHDLINGTYFGDRLMKRIESEQLAGKTPQRIKYIRESMAAIQEYEETMRLQEDQDA